MSDQRKLKNALRITGYVLLGLFGLGIIGAGVAYAKREALLRTVLERAIRKAERDYGLIVRIGSSRFTGVSAVAFTDISVVPSLAQPVRDSLARIERLSVDVRWWPLLRGQVALSEMNLENGLVQVVKRDSLTNIDFILRRNRRDSTRTETRTRTNLADVADRVIDNLLSKIPNDLSVRALEFRYRDRNAKAGDRRVSLLTQTARIDDEAVTSTLRLNEGEAVWHVSGTADPADREYNLDLYAENGPVQLRYLQERYDLKLQADTLHAELRDVGRSGGEFRIEGTGSVRNLVINHPVVSPIDVRIERAAMDANLFVGENYVGIDSSSTAYLGGVKGRPFVKYTLSESSDRPAKIYEVQFHTDPLDAQALFDAFPRGLFQTLEGIRVAGKLRYDGVFRLDTALPDSVQFSSGLTPDGFRILRLSSVDFTRISRSFVYTPYENDRPVRDIVIGPENPDFVPLSAIAPDLRNAVLTSEDYNFFTHKGFNEKAFRVSIATNYKAKSFKRGASTISMQLVKNAFLNRSKVLSRKVEEILIVWLIENGRLLSKARMYEVYLNFIEWGRNVYGIGEAARYYFDKYPSELTLGESIFLAFVIPKPKAALNYFLPDGSLQVSNVRGYFRLIGRIMARRGLTAPDSGAYGFYSVRLREGLRRQIAPIDSMGVDSLMTEPDEEGGIDDFFRRLFNGKKDREEEVEKEDDPAPAPSPAARPTEPVSVQTDTVKTRRQLRQERRERRRRERDEREKEEGGQL